MSRAPSEISNISANLPRRAVLQGAVASPLALAIAAGQVSADPLVALEDERHAAYRRLVDDEWRLTLVVNDMFDTEPGYQEADAASDAAYDALVHFEQSIWAQPIRNSADLLLRVRIAERYQNRFGTEDQAAYQMKAAGELIAGLFAYLQQRPSFAGGDASCFPAARFLGMSQEDMVAAIATDPRFAKLDALIAGIAAADLKDDTEEYSRIADELNDLAKNEADYPPRGWLDLVYLNKLADYFNVIGDVGFGDKTPIIEVAISRALEFWGVEPQKAVTRPPTDLPARPAPTPPRQYADGARVKLRKLEKQYRAAVSREMRLADGTPEHARAAAISNKREAELERYVDRLRGELSSRVSLADEFQIRCECIIVERPDLLGAPTLDRGGKLVAELLKLARDLGDMRVINAQRMAVTA